MLCSSYLNHCPERAEAKQRTTFTVSPRLLLARAADGSGMLLRQPSGASASELPCLVTAPITQSPGGSTMGELTAGDCRPAECNLHQPEVGLSKGVRHLKTAHSARLHVIAYHYRRTNGLTHHFSL